MKIHRVVLRDYKGIRSVRIEPRESGVTIIEGDNEVGKSSIAEAIWLVFEQNDDSSSQLVKSLKPADRDAATEIEIEVSTGPYRFTYLKRFHRQSRTELRVTAPRSELLAGREAHVRARQILDETIDRALWEALRLQQGANLDPIAAGQHSSLLSALDNAAGEVLGGEREETLFGRILTEYERYYTPSGREKGSGDGPNLPRLRTAKDAADAETVRITARIASLEERANQAALCQQQAAAAAEALETARAGLADLEETERTRTEQRAVVDSLAAEVRVQESALHAAITTRAARARDAAALVPRREEHQKLEARREALSGPLAQAAEAREEAHTQAETAATQLAAAQGERLAAERNLQLASAAFTAETMTERLERIERNEPEVAELTGALAASKLDRPALTAIEQARQRLDRIEARREAEGALVEVASDQPLDFKINGKPARVEAGAPRRGTVLDSTIELPGGIRITIRAGAAAQEAAGEFAAAKEALQSALAFAGVETFEAARAAFEARVIQEERLRGLREQIRADIRDLPSAEDLRQRLGRERARVANLRHDAGGAVLTIDEAKAALESVSRNVTEAEYADRSARTAHTRAEATLADLERDLREVERRLETLATEVAAMESELDRLRAEQPDEAIAAACREHEQLLAVARDQLEHAAAQLADTPDRSGELAAVRADIQSWELERSRRASEYSGHLAVLEEAGAEGLHGLLLEAEQRAVLAETELAALLRRANAARTLYEAMKAARDEARANYAAPLRTNIESLGRKVYGETFAVELTDDLRIARVSRKGLTFDLAQLSVGTREQLAVLTRLACAALVSASGGAPVVLDDILGWADPGRLRELGPILAATAAESQVLLFTCNPERFATVAPARVIRLPGGETFERTSAGESDAVPVQLAPPPDLPHRRTPPHGAPQAAFDLFAEPATASPN